MHTHSDRLERWLGPEQVAAVSRAMRGFYWPIAMHGRVWRGLRHAGLATITAERDALAAKIAAA